MNLYEAADILHKNGFLMESSIKGDFAKGEKGGEPYFDLPNDYTYEDARRYFMEAIYGKLDDEDIQIYWDNYLRKSRIKQFETTYKQFEDYKNKTKQIKLYRGLVITGGNEIDMDKPGECWSFNQATARRWVENIWDIMVINHRVNADELHNSKKVILYGTTTLDNCRLPYSIWLAGRFERPEWEVRVKDESKVKIIKSKEIE
jgi:sulfatase maturation enzyme AslB (radical SAM superfamily)